MDTDREASTSDTGTSVIGALETSRDIGHSVVMERVAEVKQLSPDQ